MSMKTAEIDREEGVKLFISYAHEDAMLKDQLLRHLASLRHAGHVAVWDPGGLSAGTQLSNEFERHLERADIILILVSSDYLASEYIHENGIERALKRHRLGLARVIPIMLRSVHWADTPLAKLQFLPSGGRPISTAEDLDSAWAEVVSSLRLVIDEVRSPIGPSVAPTPRPVLPLYEVFKPSGVPTVTFVRRADFDYLALSIAQPGRGVIIEGPSGIGKTTALKQLAPHIIVLSARKPQDIETISLLPISHSGAVAVDDFHRLPGHLADVLVNHLKYLADYEPEDKKLIILGIPRTGQRLVDLSFDLATRIDVFRLARVDPTVVSEMIEKGEHALNVVFPRKAEIVRASAGSLNVAQLLCFTLCAAEGVTATQDVPRRIAGALDEAIERVMAQISLKFGELIRYFASLGGRHDHTSIELLKELAQSDDGFLSLRSLSDTRPELRARIESFLGSDFMGELHRRVPSSQTHLLFDPTVPALIIDDPQLTFYLRQTPIQRLVRLTGKSEAVARTKVFVSYSHADSEWLQRLRVHLKPIERLGLIEVWDDTRLRAGSRWRHDIRVAIDAAKVAILLVSADFLASDFISEDELPPLLAAAERDGLVVIPVIVGPSLFNESPLAEFQAANPSSEPLSGLPKTKRERVLVRVAKSVEETVGT